MSITVTATQSGGGAFDGMGLTVKVVNNAAATQNGATAANDSTITVPELSITPSATGSWVYGAAVNGAAGTGFTAAATTTFDLNAVDTTNNAAYGTCRSTGTTTGGTPVTIGGSGPTEGGGGLGVALAEILAAGTLAEDASSPASVSTDTALTITTAAFTPPAGSLLVAVVAANYSGSGVNVLTMSNSGTALTWVKLIQTTNFGGSAVFIARNGSAGVSGALSSALAAKSAALAGRETMSGHLSSALAAKSAALAGGETMSGHLAAALAAKSAALSGAETVSGHLAAALAADSLAAAGGPPGQNVTAELAAAMAPMAAGLRGPRRGRGSIFLFARGL